MMKPPVMSDTKDTYFQPARHQDIIPLFSTPMFRGYMELNHDVIAEDVRQLVKKAYDRHGEQDISRNYTTYFDDDLREETEQLPWYNDLANILKDTYILYIRDCFGQDVAKLNRNDIHLFAWVNHYKTPHQHEVHNHVNSYISGTYYVKTQEVCQPIKFWSPNLMAQFAHNCVDQKIQRDGYDIQGTEMVESEAHFYPTDGQFLLWPSYLQHAVPPIYDAPEDYERISISFNLKHRIEIDSTHTGDAMDYEFLETEFKEYGSEQVNIHE